MARKTIEKTFVDRGNELTFRIEEMSAMQLQRWIGRALPILSPVLGLEADDLGGVASMLLDREGLIKLIGGLDYDKAEPLLNDMLRCCSRLTGNNVAIRCDPSTVDGYIEDVKTLFFLQVEAIKLNLGFLGGDAGPPSSSPGATNTTGTSQNTVRVSLNTRT
jgi:hypothetical protein